MNLTGTIKRILSLYTLLVTLVWSVTAQDLRVQWKFSVKDTLIFERSDTLRLSLSPNNLTYTVNLFSSPSFSVITFSTNTVLNFKSYEFTNHNPFAFVVIKPLRDTVYLMSKALFTNVTKAYRMEYGFLSVPVKQIVLADSLSNRKQSQTTQTLLTKNDTLINKKRKEDAAEGAVAIPSQNLKSKLKLISTKPKLFKDSLCFSIQFGRFEQSSAQRIKRYVTQMGLSNYTLHTDQEVKFLLYGAYESRSKAMIALQDFKSRYKTEAFIVQYRYKQRIR